MARKPKKGQDAPLPFPLAGLDSSDPHDKQRPLTTRDGENVQSFDMLENRARGGSRPGLTKYVGDTVTGELNLPIQCLTTVVLVSDEAMLDDDGYLGGNVAGSGIGGPGGPGGGSGGGGGGGGSGSGGSGGWSGSGGDGAGPATPPGPGGDAIPDGSSGNGRRRKPPGGRLIRPGGSGVRPTRNGKQQSQPPIARPDSGSATVGGSSLVIDVLGNDFYLGEPNFTLIAPAPTSINGSKIGTTGTGTGKRVTFTPPTSGDGPYTFTIPYRLTAKGNRGSSNSVLTIDVGSSPPAPCVFQSIQIFANRGDGSGVAVSEAGPWCSCDTGSTGMTVANTSGSVFMTVLIPSGTPVGDIQALYEAYWNAHGGYDPEVQGTYGAPVLTASTPCSVTPP